jgi:hypothetical protein
MNYKKQYESLVKTRKERILKEGEYYERHHILPKCLGGSNDKENLVVLTAREHYIAHWLLCKIYPESWKIKSALFQMAKCNGKNKRVISSSQYERAKKYNSLALKQKSKEPGYINPGKSEKSRSIAKEKWNSDLNPMIRFPERNHTAKKITVEYDDGSIKEFKMKKALALELKSKTNLTDSAIKHRINKNNLQEFGYKNIIMEIKLNKPGIASIGRKWYTNGIDNMFVFPGNEAIGFKLGRTKKIKG